MPEKIYLAGVKVDVVDGGTILNRIKNLIEENRKGSISYINAHAINLAQRLKWFKKYLNNSEISYADGQGVRLGAWLLRKPVPALVNLTRWAWELLNYCARNDYKIFLLGATESVIQKAVSNIRKKNPDVKIVGYHHGYFEKTGKPSDDVVAYINSLKPNVMLVGMGMPLQENWIKENFNSLQVNAIFNGGSCIDILAGVKKVCPQWMSNIGFEWLFRLSQEPLRLFIRYIIGNPKFLYYIFFKRK
ncbi:MAG: WecB/TagA/CpsF family glycosyltransferase [Bacteroidota bacterium]|nr:WecB/TagA/CpsF family glycosyltransferase [Bacteroidota bacterium]